MINHSQFGLNDAHSHLFCGFQDPDLAEFVNRADLCCDAGMFHNRLKTIRLDIPPQYSPLHLIEGELFWGPHPEERVIARYMPGATMIINLHAHKFEQSCAEYSESLTTLRKTGARWAQTSSKNWDWQHDGWFFLPGEGEAVLGDLIGVTVLVRHKPRRVVNGRIAYAGTRVNLN